MTTSNPDVQALIEEAREWEPKNGETPIGEQRLILDLAAALSALSGETETEWAVRAKGDSEPWTDVSDDFDWLADNMPGFINEDAEIVRRRKAGEWEVVA